MKVMLPKNTTVIQEAQTVRMIPMHQAIVNKRKRKRIKKRRKKRNQNQQKQWYVNNDFSKNKLRFYERHFQSEKPRKARKSKKEKDSNKPKRPATAFMLWLNSARDKIKADNPGIAVTEIAKKGGEMWKNLKDKSVIEFKCFHHFIGTITK